MAHYHKSRPATIYLVMSRPFDGGPARIESAFSRLDWAEARAKTVRDGDDKRDAYVKSLTLDDPWTLPAEPVPLADLTKLKETTKHHGESLEEYAARRDAGGHGINAMIGPHEHGISPAEELQRIASSPLVVAPGPQEFHPSLADELKRNMSLGPRRRDAGRVCVHCRMNGYYHGVEGSCLTDDLSRCREPASTFTPVPKD